MCDITQPIVYTLPSLCHKVSHFLYKNSNQKNNYRSTLGILLNTQMIWQQTYYFKVQTINML